MTEKKRYEHLDEDDQWFVEDVGEELAARESRENSDRMNDRIRRGFRPEAQEEETQEEE